jgi:hypothetical protein
MESLRNHCILLFGLALFFPTISWLCAIAVWADRRSKNKHFSPVYVPLIGPILMTTWILLQGVPRWTIPLAWALDIGTMAFFRCVPWLWRDYWNTSRWNRTIELAGETANVSATVSIHKTGHYHLEKHWKRPKGECGIVSHSEVGLVENLPDGFTLTMGGRKRFLRRTSERVYTAEEVNDGTISSDSSIDSWQLVVTYTNPATKV